jgi:lipopolysaccharide/colanic/teichoic acid biosynthesis glycosyltransferase
VIIHTFHGHVLEGYYGGVKSWLLRRMEQGLSYWTDCIVTVSDQIKSQLVTYGVASPEKIVVIPLGLDLQPFLNSHEHRGEFRREIGLNDGARLVGIVGRVFPIKNHRLFLDAAARVATEDPSVRFVVVGDGALRPEMEERVQGIGMSERVIFTGWRHDLPRIYADLDVLVVSSDNEGTPVSAIEAMAAGCPVVGTRVGGMPDMIVHQKTGFLVPPKDADALAKAVLRVLRGPKIARRISKTARVRVRDRFPVQRLITDMEKLYLELLTRKGIALSTKERMIQIGRPVHEPWPKRMLDIILSGLGLLLAAPLCLLIAMAIELEDRGPVFFTQQRWGRNKSRIKVYKFRSMVPEADEKWGQVQAQRRDPRITRVGRILRATAMDEIPQLWNIFKGDMSFVGPRSLPINETQAAETEQESELPDEAIPGFDERLRVRPGLTGIAQIFAPRDVPRRNKFRYDIFYIRRMSFRLDVRLILSSFLVTFLGAWEKDRRFDGPWGRFLWRAARGGDRNWTKT